MPFTWFWHHETTPPGLPSWLIVGPGLEGLGYRVMNQLSVRRDVRDHQVSHGTAPPAGASAAFPRDALFMVLTEGPDGYWKPTESQLAALLEDLRASGAIESVGDAGWQISDAARETMVAAHAIRGSTMARQDPR
jgi:hypothetical protein